MSIKTNCRKQTGNLMTQTSTTQNKEELIKDWKARLKKQIKKARFYHTNWDENCAYNRLDRDDVKQVFDLIEPVFSEALLNQKPKECSMNVYVDEKWQIRSISYAINKAKKAERQRLIEEVRELVDGMRKNTTLSHACLQSWGGCDCNDNKNYNQALDDLLQAIEKLREEHAK